MALAERLNIPVATSLNGKDTIPANHPLSVGVVGTYSRESANIIVNEADLVVYIGSSTGGMVTHFWAVPKIGTKVVHIDKVVHMGRLIGLAKSLTKFDQGVGSQCAETETATRY